jgi:hypothetical protein
MIVATAILLNTLVAIALYWWLRREYLYATPSLRRWLAPALCWRLLLTAISGWLPGPDAKTLTYWGQGLIAEFWTRPSAVLALLQDEHIRANGEVLTRYSFSNTIFFIKILGVLNLASLGSIWLNSLYMSIFCFVGCWLLVRTWAQLFPHTPLLAIGIALLLWPSVVWWTTGIGKETILLGSEAIFIALSLRQIYRSPVEARPWLLDALDVLLLSGFAWLAYRMRYFFALPLAGGLLALAAVHLSTRRGWLGPGRGAQAASLLLLLALGGGLGLWVAVHAVSDGFYSQQFYGQYARGLAASVGKPHLTYAHLAPTAASLLRYAPEAIGQVLVRPWPGESSNPLYIGVGIENLALLGLLGLAAAALSRGQAGRLPAALVVLLLVYCLTLAAFIGLSTPNLGTLHRYRAALLPWLLLLLLQNDYAHRLLRRLTRKSKT